MPRTVVLILSLLLLNSGCQQARSFLHMNSDSPAPFMGFELSVDADHRLPNRERDADHVASLARVSHRNSRGEHALGRIAAANRTQRTDEPGEVIELSIEQPTMDETATIDALLARFGH